MQPARKKARDDTRGGKVLNHIENVNKPLDLDKINLMSSKSVGKPLFPEPKSKIKEDKKELIEKVKKSVWKWKGFKALTHARDRRFDCYFSVHVHSIEGLPPVFDDLSLVVHWKRRDVEFETRPAMVCNGVAEFKERLVHSCSVYGRSGTNHVAKYEAKHFLLYASVHGTPEVDLGKQPIDLARLLPLTLEELEEKSSGKWSTSYRLSGEAKGGILNVSFGYEVAGNHKTQEMNSGLYNNFRQNSECRVLRQTKHAAIHRTGSLPAISCISKQSSEDIKDLHEVLPVTKSESSDSISMLYSKHDELRLNTLPEINLLLQPDETIKPDSNMLSDAIKENDGDDSKKIYVCGLVDEISKSVEHIRVAAHESTGSLDACGAVDVVAPEAEEQTKHLSTVEFLDCDYHFKEAEESQKKELKLELELVLANVPDLSEERFDTEDGSVLSNSENHTELTAKYIVGNQKSHELLDDAAETIASEFLDLLGMDHSPFGLNSESDPESPRERLLRQFEKDTLARGFSFLNLNEEDTSEFIFDTQTEAEFFPFGHDFEELFRTQAEPNCQKTKGKLLEAMETEALMHEWGITEKVFHGSPLGGFGSPIDMPQPQPQPLPQIPDHLPSLGQGLGPFVQTRNGEIICSMNPALFKNPKNGGSLIMQVSSPVVVPAELGSSVMDILHNLAAIGIEKLSLQANKLMPLEDINGWIIQEIAWEAAQTFDGPGRDTPLLLQESASGKGTSDKNSTTKAKASDSKNEKLRPTSVSFERDSEYVSLEDLSPMAINRNETLAIEGLKIQSGMSDDVSLANINPQFIGECSALESTRSTGLEGSGGLQLLKIKGNGEDDEDDVDGLMALSLSLDEWMKLDSGEIYDEDGISERTSKLLAAHHAKSTDMIQGRLKGEKRRFNESNIGLLGNNFNVALMVQLRDPLQGYEPVGAPILALIQVERVFTTPKPKIYTSVSKPRYADEVDDDDDDDDDTDPSKKDIDDVIPQFKITEVHVAGLKTEAINSKVWVSQQSGSRWLAANGMGKKNKHPLLKSEAEIKSSMPGSTNALWSVSSSSHRRTGAKLNSHVRNPDVTLRNEPSSLQQRSRFLGFI